MLSAGHAAGNNIFRRRVIQYVAIQTIPYDDDARDSISTLASKCAKQSCLVHSIFYERFTANTKLILLSIPTI